MGGAAVRTGRGARRGAVLARAAVLAGLATLLAGCGLVGGPTTFHADVPNRITVTSPDLTKGVLGPAFTCHGHGRHPVIHWSGAPQGTKSFALVMDDSSAPIRPYIYWIVFDIGPERTVIQPGQIPPGARQARNSKGTVGYSPPCPMNQSHAYRFTVYALRSMLTLKSGTGVKAAWTRIAQEAIARGRLPAIANP